MQWLQQNWLVVVLGAGILFFLMRVGRMGGMGNGSHSQSSHHHGNSEPSETRPGQTVAQTIDPVSGKPLDPATAVSTLYRGTPVYFESHANRDRFESSPDKFPITPAATSPSHRHGGC